VPFVIWAKGKGLSCLLNLNAPAELKTYYKFIDDSVSERIRQEKQGRRNKAGETRQEKQGRRNKAGET
jgi:hypothetical protein